jgi:hypothetical protein
MSATKLIFAIELVFATKFVVVKCCIILLIVVMVTICLSLKGKFFSPWTLTNLQVAMPQNFVLQ